MAAYWFCSLFVNLWTSTPSRSINMQTEIELGQYPTILTEKGLSSNLYRILNVSQAYLVLISLLVTCNTVLLHLHVKTGHQNDNSF